MDSKDIASLFASLSISSRDSPIQLLDDRLMIPLLCMTKEIGRFLGGMIGEVLEVDGGASRDCVGKFMRIPVVNGKANFPFGLWLRASGSSSNFSYQFHKGLTFSSVKERANRREDRGNEDVLPVPMFGIREDGVMGDEGFSMIDSIGILKQSRVTSDLMDSREKEVIPNDFVLKPAICVSQKQNEEIDVLMGNGTEREVINAKEVVVVETCSPSKLGEGDKVCVLTSSVQEVSSGLDPKAQENGDRYKTEFLVPNNSFRLKEFPVEEGPMSKNLSSTQLEAILDSCHDPGLKPSRVRDGKNGGKRIKFPSVGQFGSVEKTLEVQLGKRKLEENGNEIMLGNKPTRKQGNFWEIALRKMLRGVR
ncbi:hypothetical protein EZV62_015958 [Acer yangbiense]|uniref:DUF4283 domain-containing protein n=1 Tax=Acer yangbiense TaxID=1000413 RepID=A0A5C7HMT2_9ROSI|nr:hypothetical protein EZV62_015958 [Acer yangbiense]